MKQMYRRYNKILYTNMLLNLKLSNLRLLYIRKQPKLKKFKQQSSKDTKIFSRATIGLSRKNCNSVSYFLPFNNI